MDINERLRDAEFKDDKPLKTVERIRKILKDNGMEAEETWGESGVPYCYSIRIGIRGTTFATNGKGLTKEFTLASGYGELMERLQLGYLSRDDAQKSDSAVNDSQDELVSAEELLRRNRDWYEKYADCAKRFTGVQLTPEEILKQFTDENGNVEATPYFCATTQTKEYIPAAVRKLIYTTNGCAAGNTLEEAVVQAISEIVERSHKMRVLTEEMTAPDIPEDVLKRYPTAYDIISYVRSKGFSVFVKDCSLGTKFPVVCVCFIDQKSGKYHTHFGANPIFEIALERALTESFQGRSIDNLAKYSDFSYSKAYALSLNGLSQEMVKGESEKLPEFFIGKPKGEWTGAYGFSGQNNRELMKECLAFFAEQGYDVLIRDCSCLGFPTCQVLVPGYSEVFSQRFSQNHNDFRFIPYVAKVLRDPTAAGLDDMLALLMHMELNDKLPKNLSARKFTAMAKLSADISPAEEGKLMAATMGCVYYNLGKLKECADCVQRLISACAQDEQEYLICLRRYLSMKLYRYDSEQIRALLDLCHRPETVAEIYRCLEEKRNPLERFVLHCNTQCDERCPLRCCCYQRQAKQMAKAIIAKTRGMDFEASAEMLRKLL